MLKVTLKFSFYCVIISFCSCWQNRETPVDYDMQRIADSVSEARIDSAYAAINKNCDTLLVYQVPRMVDSLLKDSALLLLFFDTDQVYSDADKKVEKVVRQLQAACDTNLLKETYKTARLRQKSKKPLRKKG